ncbi:MAG TPA: glycogen debranching enzyme N-terminal domain-containing protein [Polyangiaceae bacterium]|nr:glycogen debranching enzyme N-terminal domain-containing protein [Polyangiaceae bacterium]
MNRPLADPWPVVDTYGELHATEWIHTNGAGAYAMSTVPMMHTRRYHGILVAPLVPPLGRYVMLSHVELTLHANGKQHRLSTHQFPGLAPTPGYRLLRRFAMDPIPRWTYRIGEYEFERDLCLARRRNISVMRFTWHGDEPATLYLRPLLPLRRIHELMHEHGAMVQRVALRQREVEIQPNVDLPPLCFRHSGVFVGSPDWWRRFEYLEDRTRAAEFQEDLWTPGTFEIVLIPGKPQFLVTAVQTLPTESAQDIVDETCSELRHLDIGSTRPDFVRRLTIAAECYRVASPTCTAIIAGYPWYGVHLVPALQALSGLCLVPGQLDFAKRSLACMMDLQHAGLLPELITETGHARGPCSPTATLFLFEAVLALLGKVSEVDDFIRGVAYPAMVRAFVRLRSKHFKRLVWLTSDGLLANAADDRPLTWMNGQVGNWIVTPRRGIAVELQALWSRGCETLEHLARIYGHELVATQARQAREAAREAFRRRFWCADTDYPFDCVGELSGHDGGWSDPSVRCNALIALAIDPELFEPWQADAILAKVQRDLLTPRGIRTLSPQDKMYQGYHEGGLEEREGSAHQGTAWPYLLGYYVRAQVRQAPDDDELRRDLRELVEGVLSDPLAVLQVPEMADGDSPNRFRACPASALAVAELLRAMVEDLEY